MLLGAQRPDHRDLAVSCAALLQLGDRAHAIEDCPPHATSAIGGEPPRLRHMVVILHEQRIGLARRQHADGFGRHRPAGEPLHRGAEAVGAAEHQMIAAGFAQQRLDGVAAPRHLAIGKARVFSLGDALERVGQGGHSLSLCQMTYRSRRQIACSR